MRVRNIGAGSERGRAIRCRPDDHAARRKDCARTSEMASLSSTRRTRGRSDEPALPSSLMSRRQLRLRVDARLSRHAALRDVKANGGLHASATPGAGLNLEQPANHFHSLFHTQEAEAVGRHDLSIKPDAIVDDAHAEFCLVRRETYGEFLGLAVFDRVVQRLLNDSEQT